MRLSSLRSADTTSQKIMSEFSQAGSGESISRIGHFLQNKTPPIKSDFNKIEKGLAKKNNYFSE